MASHVLPEIEQIANRVMILLNGRLLTTDALRPGGRWAAAAAASRGTGAHGARSHRGRTGGALDCGRTGIRRPRSPLSGGSRPAPAKSRSNWPRHWSGAAWRCPSSQPCDLISSAFFCNLTRHRARPPHEAISGAAGSRKKRPSSTSPIAYVLIAVFLLIMGYSFTLALFISHSMTLVHLFFQIFVLFLLTVPIITMRLIAEERKLRTMEVLLTSPVTETQIVFAKFAASMSLIVLMLILSAAYAIVLAIYGRP